MFLAEILEYVLRKLSNLSFVCTMYILKSFTKHTQEFCQRQMTFLGSDDFREIVHFFL